MKKCNVSHHLRKTRKGMRPVRQHKRGVHNYGSRPKGYSRPSDSEVASYYGQMKDNLPKSEIKNLRDKYDMENYELLSNKRKKELAEDRQLQEGREDMPTRETNPEEMEGDFDMNYGSKPRKIDLTELYKEEDVDPDKIDFSELGYKTAKGEAGTGWMAVSERDIEELKQEIEKNPEKREELIDEFASGWEETLQWEYEVGKHLPKIKSDDDIDKFSEKRTDWEMGFTAFLQEKLGDNKPKVDPSQTSLKNYGMGAKMKGYIHDLQHGETMKFESAKEVIERAKEVKQWEKENLSKEDLKEMKPEKIETFEDASKFLSKRFEKVEVNPNEKYYVGVSHPWPGINGMFWEAEKNIDNLSPDMLAKLGDVETPIKTIEAKNRDEAIKKYKEMVPDLKNRKFHRNYDSSPKNKNKDVIGRLSESAFSSVELGKITHDIDDSIKVRDSYNGKKTKWEDAKIEYDDEGKPFFNRRGEKYHLDEFMRE